MTKPRTKRNAEPLPSHVHRGHPGSTQTQQAGLSSARRQSIDQAWAEVVAATDAKLAGPAGESEMGVRR